MRLVTRLFFAVTICLFSMALSGQAVEQTAQDAAFDWRAFRDRLNAANPGLNLTDRNFLSCERLCILNITWTASWNRPPWGKDIQTD